MSTAIAVVGVVIALVAGAFAFGSWRRDRRHRVRVEHSSTRLVKPGSPELEIRLRGQTPLTDPYSATVELAARKPHDVDPDAFAGKPLRVEFGAQVMTVSELNGHPDSAAVLDGWREQFYESGTGRLKEQRPPWPTYVDLPPALLSVSAPWSLTVLCDGAPQPEVAGFLIDTDWVSGSRDTDRQSYVRGAALGITLSGVLAAIGVAILKDASGRIAPDLVNVVAYIVCAIQALIFLFFVISRRP